MTAIGTMIISLSGTHTFAKPSIVRYIITDRIIPDSVFLSFRSILQENLPHLQSYPLARLDLS